MSTRFLHRRIIVIPAALQAEANAMALQLDPAGGDKTFTVPLSPTGALPATHYWCATSATVEGKDGIEQMRATLAVARKVARVFDEKVTTPEQVLTTMGLKRIAADVGGR